jgi:AraC-like DNA-binding protein
VRDCVPSVTADTRWAEFLQAMEAALGDIAELPNRNRPVSEQFFSEALEQPTKAKAPAGGTLWAALGMLGCLAVRGRVPSHPYANAVPLQVSQRFGLGLDHLLRDFSRLGGLALAEAAAWLVEHYVVRRHLHVALRKLSFQRQRQNT